MLTENVAGTVPATGQLTENVAGTVSRHPGSSPMILGHGPDQRDVLPAWRAAADGRPR
ncbi:MAG TPA: hypothetical protein VMH35_18390 [Streptosporangiaceae bacterium]|nr:hypothetical protein [Streptosporangiaceae bacterium]